MYEYVIKENHAFTMWSAEHVLALLFFALLGYIIIRRAASAQMAGYKNRLFMGMGWVISGTVIGWSLIKISLGNFSINQDLPLPLCNFLALVLPVFTITRSLFLFELFYFWVLSGTLQAIITPDLQDSFPHYHFIKYWVVHLGLVIVVVYAAVVYQMRPSSKSILKAFLWLQPYVLFCMAVNYLLHANYLYLNAKPPVASLLDFMGPWPVYIFVAQLIAMPLFLLAYLPFWLYKRKLRAAAPHTLN
ncbi:TIGR02206 family membrane protein [Sphingobacteriales bacterium UPWRP_1]|nr:hypothetical protein BVG80_01150 [Sphingobacteriales bacterium TSM_CSM]PSJ72646.1 TIGR02206 family membrane protein [Sphingobacteriales bacterium UPWRP_1]